jgi:hypothetical protein
MIRPSHHQAHSRFGSRQLRFNMLKAVRTGRWAPGYAPSTQRESSCRSEPAVQMPLRDTTSGGHFTLGKAQPRTQILPLGPAQWCRVQLPPILNPNNQVPPLEMQRFRGPTVRQFGRPEPKSLVRCNAATCNPTARPNSRQICAWSGAYLHSPSSSSKNHGPFPLQAINLPSCTIITYFVCAHSVSLWCQVLFYNPVYIQRRSGGTPGLQGIQVEFSCFLSTPSSCCTIPYFWPQYWPISVYGSGVYLYRRTGLFLGYRLHWCFFIS